MRKRNGWRNGCFVYFEWSRDMETMATNYYACVSAVSQSNTYYIRHTFNVGLKGSRGLQPTGQLFYLAKKNVDGCTSKTALLKGHDHGHWYLVPVN